MVKQAAQKNLHTSLCFGYYFFAALDNYRRNMLRPNLFRSAPLGIHGGVSPCFFLREHIGGTRKYLQAAILLVGTICPAKRSSGRQSRLFADGSRLSTPQAKNHSAIALPIFYRLRSGSRLLYLRCFVLRPRIVPDHSLLKKYFAMIEKIKC
jgi:hypothetical protein